MSRSSVVSAPSMNMQPRSADQGNAAPIEQKVSLLVLTFAFVHSSPNIVFFQKLDHGIEDMQKYLSSIRSSLSKGHSPTESKWPEPEWSPRPESRNSIASTATNNSASFSNRASRSSTISSDNSVTSTRSSVSLDDLDFSKVSVSSPVVCKVTEFDTDLDINRKP